MEQKDGLRIVGRFKIEAFDLNGILVKTLESRNLAVNVGIQLLEDLLIGAGGTAYNLANSFIGAGDGNTAPAASQTNLQGTNKLRKAATSVSRTDETLTWVATFGTGEANFDWEELGIFNHVSAGTMLCRSLVPGPFTKTSSLTVTVTYTFTGE